LRLNAGTAYQDASTIKKERVQSAIASNIGFEAFLKAESISNKISDYRRLSEGFGEEGKKEAQKAEDILMRWAKVKFEETIAANPQQQVKIPTQPAQSGAVEPKLLSVMEEIKAMVGKINAPVVNQKFEQVNHLAKGDIESEKMAKQLDKQVRQGMDRFITELKRVK